MMYPYCLYDENLPLYPVFKDLQGAPLLLDLSPESQLLLESDFNDQKAFQRFLERKMEGHYSWGVGVYLERRDTILAEYPQMVEEGRFIHLGLDVIVPLGKVLHAPLEGIVQESGYE